MMENNLSYIIPPLVFAYLIGITQSHVALTFPPARKLDLDFLDYFRTKMPCGMPKGRYRTVLQAGSTINVTWHLAYPHVGGYRIELLDKNENFTMKLSNPSSSDDYISGDPTMQWHTIQVPDTPCEDCTLRLLREAKEWKDYGYWTCADISIVKKNDYKEDCLGRGKVRSNSICSCETGYWGPRCQYKDECGTDTDCGKGKCIDVGGTSLPAKQCFCSAGFHGNRCELQNKDTLPTPENLQLSSHKKTILSDRMTLYHRVVDASVKESDKEMEFILIVDGTSYGAIGWRPSSVDKSCRSMPAIDDEMDMTSLSRYTRAARGRPQKSNPTLLEPLHRPERIMAAESTMNSKRSTKGIKKVSPQPEPEPEPEPEVGGKRESAKPEGHSNPEPEHNKLKSPTSKLKNEPTSEPESTSEPKSEPETSSQPKSEPEVSSEPESEPEKSSEPKSEPEKSSEPKSEPEASSEPKSEPEVSSEPKSEPEATSEPKSEPEVSSEPKSEPEVSSEPKSEPEATSEPKSEPEATSEPKSEPEASSEPESEPSNPKTSPEKISHSEPEPEAAADQSVAAVVFAEPESGNTYAAFDDLPPFKLEKRNTSYTPMLNDFHPMDCTDIIVGTARGMYSRIRDFYTRDRSTPRLDTIYGGTDDITSATGWEMDGVTTIIFRRKIKTSDPTDYELTGPMKVIWARGQEHGQYVHTPKSGLETENPSIPNFYTQDELKYHGQLNQRGVTIITF